MSPTYLASPARRHADERRARRSGSAVRRPSGTRPASRTPRPAPGDPDEPHAQRGSGPRSRAARRAPVLADARPPAGHRRGRNGDCCRSGRVRHHGAQCPCRAQGPHCRKLPGHAAGDPCREDPPRGRGAPNQDGPGHGAKPRTVDLLQDRRLRLPRRDPALRGDDGRGMGHLRRQPDRLLPERPDRHPRVPCELAQPQRESVGRVEHHRDA